MKVRMSEKMIVGIKDKYIEEAMNYMDNIKEKKILKGKKSSINKVITGLVTAATILVVIHVSYPTLAEKFPIVGHVFELLGNSFGFSGDYKEYAVPMERILQTEEAKETSNTTGKYTEKNSFSQTFNGMTITLSEVYCNDAAIYMSLLIETNEKFPETLMDSEGNVRISLQDCGIYYSYNPRRQFIISDLDGKMYDEHTFMGILRGDLLSSLSYVDEQYEVDRDAFFESIAGEGELENDPDTAYKKIQDFLGGPAMSPGLITRAGGPDIDDYSHEVEEIPESFGVKLEFSQVVGSLPEDTTPPFTSGDIAEYTTKYPEMMNLINSYKNWWVDGKWSFEFDVIVDHTNTIRSEFEDIDGDGRAIKTVIKTPFEIKVEEISVGDLNHVIVLDANGEMLPNGGVTGTMTNLFAIKDRDVSKIDVYIIQESRFQNEIQGLLEEENVKHILDEIAYQHEEIVYIE